MHCMPGSLEAFGEQWMLLEGSAGVLSDLLRRELLILSSLISPIFHRLQYIISSFP